MTKLLSFLNPLVVIGSAIGTYYVVKHTRTKGKMGINAEAFRDNTQCPNCGANLPRLRVPKNLSEVLWGGWTCSQCQRSFDKWLRPRN